ncbi:response regulator [Aurantibacillus circumpalustris]|uniref:response regulator n=1 Tax=Aurantibacillus circumpalustris TaxID=3036359 RepID=UPI00295A628B|nr:response regulator [Aurantibacillus circumpalustris]
MSPIKTLTLVDDDDVFVFLTKKAIEQTKLVDLIKVFENGLDALNFLKENKNNVDVLPEIILLDLSMPIMNGWQFLEEYTKLNPTIGKKISIYICSSSISPDDVTRAKTISEVSDYIIKPITKDKLIDLIKKL